MRGVNESRPTAMLIHGRSLLTGLLGQAEVPEGGLIVDGGVIVDVGPAGELRRRHRVYREIGGSDRVVAPGLASAHQHGGGVSSVQLGCPDQVFERWIIRMLGVPPLDPYLDTLFHAVRFIERGITTTIHSHYTRDPGHFEAEVTAHLKAWRESGIRVAFAPCFLNNNQYVYGANDAFIDSLPGNLAAEAVRLLDIGIDISAYLDLVTELRSEYAGDNRTRVLLGPVAPQWCTKDAMRRMSEEGDPSQGIHTHLLESPAQRQHLDRWLGCSVVTWLDELGMVNAASSFAHGVWLQPMEISLLAERAATVVHNPSSNLRVQNGIAPVSELRRAGVRIALGTDDMTLADDDDLLAEARLAGVLARARGAALTPAEQLAMATAHGAFAAGFGGLAGTLAPGNRADVVLIDAEELVEPAALQDVSMLELVIARGYGRHVRTVIIDGKVVFDDGHHTWVDRAGLIRELRGVASKQTSDPRYLRMADVGEGLARAWDAYPKELIPAFS